LQEEIGLQLVTDGEYNRGPHGIAISCCALRT